MAGADRRGEGPPAPHGGPAANGTLANRVRLMLVTDPEASARRSLEEVVEAALGAGVTAIQLRDKHAGTGTLLPLARRLREQCRRYRALFLVNDRVDLALASGADGVHVGQEDLPVEAVRRIVPAAFVVGVSAATPELARQAEEGGADYIGCGPIWATDSKRDAGGAIGSERLEQVVRAVRIPVVAIGGITPERSPEVRATGAAGLAVIRAILGARDPGAATQALLGPARPDYQATR